MTTTTLMNAQTALVGLAVRIGGAIARHARRLNERIDAHAVGKPSHGGVGDPSQPGRATYRKGDAASGGSAKRGA